MATYTCATCGSSFGGEGMTITQPLSCGRAGCPGFKQASRPKAVPKDEAASSTDGTAA